MERLPAEVVITIVLHLPLSGKLECIRVSKAWNRWITSTILYQKIVLYGKIKFRKAINLFHKGYGGKTVRHLVVNQDESNLKKITLLPVIFPFVQVLEWTEASSYIDSGGPSAVNWRYIERLVYCPKYHRNMPYFLHFFTFTNLKYLQVDLRYRGGGKKQQASQSIINSLYLTPFLEQLVMVRLLISISDMEKIHQDLPMLRYIKLFEIEMAREQTEPLHIQNPADQLELFHLHFNKLYRISNASCKVTLKKWLTYVGGKYKHLQYLSIIGYGKPLHSINIKQILTKTHLIDKSNIKSYKIQL